MGTAIKIPDPIIVVGTPRSGTSLVAGALHRLGAWVGECRPPNAFNPGGYFENERFRQLRLDHRDPTHERVRTILEDEDYPGGPWLVKHMPGYAPRWLPYWRPRFVLTSRDPAASARSRARLKTRWDPPYDYQAALLRALADVQKLVEFARRPDVDTVWVEPDVVVRGDLRQLHAAAIFADLPWKESTVRAWIKPEWWGRC